MKRDNKFEEEKKKTLATLHKYFNTRENVIQFFDDFSTILSEATRRAMKR